jgi:transcriptional regulator with XRE-family HTH domain
MTRIPQPDRALAEAIAVLRAERGLSREALAFRSRTTPRTVEQVEGAEIIPRWDTVRGLARGLGVTLGDFGEVVERCEAVLRADVEEGPVA